MKFIKIRDVKSPERGTEQSAGIDFFVPNYSEDFIKDFLSKNRVAYDEEKFKVYPHERVLVPSGIKVSIPKDTALIAFNKSGVAVSKGLDLGACVVDSDYQGEILINLINTSNDIVPIDWGSKIVQFILVPVLFNNPIDVESEEELYRGVETERGEGGFGSTGV